MKKPKPHELPEELRDKRLLGPNEKFNFGCHGELKCFNQCCADVSIMLTPYDILRLARKLDITTGEFLDNYTLTPLHKKLQLPVKFLKMNDEEAAKPCHFVGEDGCTVYHDRPWACRMYPIGSALPPARAGVEPKPIFYQMEADFCQGHGEPRQWTVAEWRQDQGVVEQEELEQAYNELVSHPWFIGGRQLDPKRIEMFHTACYDLDTFRRFIFSSTFLERFELEEELVEQLRTDDVALLRFAFRWLRFALFGEPTLKAKTEA